jgi:hydroxypyruvate reductase
MKVTLRELFHTMLERLAIEQVMRSEISCQNRVLEVAGERVELEPFKKILVVAIGKAAAPMAAALGRIVAPDVVSGVVVAPAPPAERLRHFMTYRGGHPYPDAGSFYAASVAQELLEDLKPYYLVVYLLSGGGSALCEKPVSDAISLDDTREFYRLLVTCGANIVEMNVLRKHLSAIKGGRLAAQAHPARQMTLYVSDVPADQPSTVASGPTMPDESTAEDCYEIAARYQLAGRLPRSIRRMFEERTIPETPKPGAEAFSNSSWHCLLENQSALDELEAAARARRWVVEIDTSVDDWPLAKAANHLLRRLERLREENPGRTVALVTGGELSCPVTGDGLGGRNQTFVLDCVPKIAGKKMAVLSAGTDGIDGNSAAAGAVADSATIERARDSGLDPEDFQRRSDSFHFFEALGDTLLTGPTGNNVRDVRVLVAW